MTDRGVVRVVIDHSDFVRHRSEAELQFAVRRRLEAAGIPLGPNRGVA